MASVPPQQRRPSKTEQSTASPISADSDDQSASSAITDTQKVVLNHPREKETQEPSAGQQSTESAAQPEPRHCWICLQDEERDAPSTSKWRTPCPCNLEAHDECLLEWIADLESSSSNDGNSKILCPQCKAEIKVEKPQDILMLTINLLSNFGRLLTDLALPSAAFGCLYTGSMVYGANAIHMVFGMDETALLLDPGEDFYKNAFYKPFLKGLFTANPFLPFGVAYRNWRAFFGLPAIAPILILSRSSWADAVFITIPILVCSFYISCSMLYLDS